MGRYNLDTNENKELIKLTITTVFNNFITLSDVYFSFLWKGIALTIGSMGVILVSVFILLSALFGLLLLPVTIIVVLLFNKYLKVGEKE